MRFAITEEAGVELGLDQNLLELGLDSLRAAQFASQARRPTRAPPAPAFEATATYFCDRPTHASSVAIMPPQQQQMSTKRVDHAGLPRVRAGALRVV